IERVKQVLEENLPEVKFRTAHGRMQKNRLENIMSDFLKRKFDVLITTTIIESGLDMPDVNTIIISNAERFGLSQLYQLRGRVGRRDRQAFAYLMVKDTYSMTDVQSERLKTIESYADSGAGFMIAMKDLEIRGTGNVVGMKQHGNMEKVGFEMYCSMLEEAVAKLENKETVKQKNTEIKADFKAVIPDSYIWDTAEKITFYKRLFAASRFEEVDAVEKEIRDVWGRIPEEVANILLTAKIKIFGKKTLADEVVVRGNEFIMLWEEEEDFDRKGMMRILKDIKGTGINQRRVEIRFLSREHLLDMLSKAEKNAEKKGVLL
ncbi:MAG TPA: transcription-repair coupling factor, partial [Firmicutes bacterium]|nr:transcription-repair coupling factor [Bacillota bacterium]